MRTAMIAAVALLLISSSPSSAVRVQRVAPAADATLNIPSNATKAEPKSFHAVGFQPVWPKGFTPKPKAAAAAAPVNSMPKTLRIAPKSVKLMHDSVHDPMNRTASKAARAKLSPQGTRASMTKHKAAPSNASHSENWSKVHVVSKSVNMSQPEITTKVTVVSTDVNVSSVSSNVSSDARIVSKGSVVKMVTSSVKETVNVTGHVVNLVNQDIFSQQANKSYKAKPWFR